eukprot:6194412-Pleurochrysis_carterae.AAC.2
MYRVQAENMHHMLPTYHRNRVTYAENNNRRASYAFQCGLQSRNSPAEVVPKRNKRASEAWLAIRTRGRWTWQPCEHAPSAPSATDLKGVEGGKSVCQGSRPLREGRCTTATSSRESPPHAMVFSVVVVVPI